MKEVHVHGDTKTSCILLNNVLKRKSLVIFSGLILSHLRKKATSGILVFLNHALLSFSDTINQ